MTANIASTARALAQDAANWYVSRMDPFKSNSENIRCHLRGPVLALTVKTLLVHDGDQCTDNGSGGGASAAPVAESDAPTPPRKNGSNRTKDVHSESVPSAADAPASNGTTATAGTAETPERNGNGAPAQQKTTTDWKDYLYSSDNPQETNAMDGSNERCLQLYERLSRRSKTRMEAMLVGCMLTTNRGDDPSDDAEEASQSSNSIGHHLYHRHRHHHHHVSIQDGLSGFHTTPKKDSGTTLSAKAAQSPILDSVRLQSSALVRQMTPPAARRLYPQISEGQLVTRLELYIRTLLRVRSLKEECVIAMETPKAIKARARCLVLAFVDTAACVRSMSPCLSRLLSCLTKEVLAVDTLSNDADKVIRRIVSDYEHKTSFASLAFLSTPETAADARLTPVIVKYLKYLQANWEEVVRECELERMLSLAIDPEIRKYFKTVEFQSIGHLLEVCQVYKSKLQHIELPPNVSVSSIMADGNRMDTAESNRPSAPSLLHSSTALKQALRDLQREVITINGHVLPPVTSRKDLIHVLSQALNSRSLASQLPKARVRRGRGRTKNIRSAFRQDTNTGPVARPKADTASEQTMDDSVTATTHADADADATKSSETLTVDAAARAAAESAGQRSQDDSDILSSDVEESSEAYASTGNDDTDNNSVARHNRRLPKSLADRTNRKPSTRRNFHLSTVDLLTRRLMIAASRTGTGGDAYFLVRDLFGGEDVEVVPSQSVSTIPTAENMVRPGTIDILVRLTDIIIKCHASFDIYPKSMVGECEPLIQFHTTTTETISLQEVRSSDSYDSITDVPDDGHSDDSKGMYGKIQNTVVQERLTPKTGWRTISMRPALYEKVEVWNTPS